jgi:hypothetical protein
MTWTQADKTQWFNEQTVKRSYFTEVVSKIRELCRELELEQYGTLTTSGVDYPVFLLKTQSFDPAKRTILITGGVHGYETSGVHGALEFMKTDAPWYKTDFNLICAPCISPWAYETINRWNLDAIDPNRSFVENSPAEECALFLKALAPYQSELLAHFDLHETTDTDNTVFRPAKASRDGKSEPWSEIPDGFYTVGDSANPCPEFQAAIIAAVKKVTHIAPPDSDGKLIGAPLEQEGVIHYPLKKLGLCAGFSNAKFTTTTEVYPDSPRITNSICVEAQSAAIRGGLDFILGIDQSLKRAEII